MIHPLLFSDAAEPTLLLLIPCPHVVGADMGWRIIAVPEWLPETLLKHQE